MSGYFFLIAPFPDHCLLLPFLSSRNNGMAQPLKDLSLIYYLKVDGAAVVHMLKQKGKVGKDQEKAQSERDSHSKNQGGKKPN